MRADGLLALAVLAFASVAHAEVVDPRADYPEGPLWRDGKLFYTEMGIDQVSVIADGRKQAYWRERGCGPTSLAPWGDAFLVLCHRGAQLVALGAAGVKRRWEQTDDGAPLQNPNDSSVDGKGGVYISDPGVFSISARVTGAVLYLAPDGSLQRVAQGLRYPNGVLVDRAERALYVDEHLMRRILRYPIRDDGTLGVRTVFADLNALTTRIGDYAEAGPDGLERGPDGNLYVCLYGEGRIVRLSPEGRLLGSIPVATPYLTNIAFAPDGSAYVTGAFENLIPPFRGQVERIAPPRLQNGRAAR